MCIRDRITGHFTPEEAKDLANVLKSGKMAASVHIVQEDVVGPSLGQEAISSGVISFALALILLMIYMCAFYGIIPGLIADGALVLNIFFTMGILASCLLYTSRSDSLYLPVLPAFCYPAAYSIG